jgi:hypothetical protein
MRGGAMDVRRHRLPDVEAPEARATIRSDPDSWTRWRELPRTVRTPRPRPAVACRAPSRESLGPRRGPSTPGGRSTPGGLVSSDDDLLERTLAFSGSYVSDDGNVTIRRSVADLSRYSGNRFVGQCTVCARARFIPPTGQALADVREAVQFVATHDHGDCD